MLKTGQPIITSLLDLDLYKLTVQQIALLEFGYVSAEYSFTCRNKDKVDLLKYVPEEELREQLALLADLRLTAEERDYLAANAMFMPQYVEYLSRFRFGPSKPLTITRDEENRTYKITAKGKWVDIILYETLVLSIVNEIFERNYTGPNKIQIAKIGTEKFWDKMTKLEAYNQECKRDGFEVPKIIEFGTRRRYSKTWQETILSNLAHYQGENLVGTSNVNLARKHGLKPIGTFGHEFPMFMQGVGRVQDSQKEAFALWYRFYGDLLSIALTDTLGDKKFLKDFTEDLARDYRGVRHDSGDPFAYGEMIIKMYEGYDIDPKTKTIVFSDGLDIDLVIALHRRFRGRINIIFGIGTNLTNDVGCPVLHIVMKLIMSNGQPVAKVSADSAKGSCIDPEFFRFLLHALENY